LKSPEVEAVVAELADSSVNFAVLPWVSSEDYRDVRFELLEQIKK
jgi:small conductance mechanosensitive channel